MGGEPSDALVARYAAAVRTHFPEPPSAADAAVLACVRRRAWTAGPLDAASGLLHPGNALRNRLLLMAALLEATPEFADAFLPRHVGPLALVARVAGAGAVAVVNALVGAVVYRAVARRAA